MYREKLLAEGVQRRDQGDDQRRVADEEQTGPRAISPVAVPPSRVAAVPDQVGQPEPD
jgi:hypothetical protein